MKKMFKIKKGKSELILGKPGQEDLKMKINMKSFGQILIFVYLLVLLILPHSYAGSAKEKPSLNNQKKVVLPKKSIDVLLPDLIISDISFANNCSIKFNIKNIGKGGVPATAYSNKSKVFLKMYAGNKFIGGISLSAVDPSGRLKKPGGSVRGVASPPKFKPSGKHSIKVVLDTTNIIKESNEKNNSITRILVCQNKKGSVKRETALIGQSNKVDKNKLMLLPDLTVTKIELDNDCDITATLKNLGPGFLPNEVYQASIGSVRFYVGQINNGYKIAYIDPLKKLRPPGGTLTIKAPGTMQRIPPSQSRTVRVYVDSVAGIGPSHIKEINENNNELTKTLACSAGGTPIPVMESAIKDIKISQIEKIQPLPPLQIKRLTIGSDAAGNCYVHMHFNRDANSQLPLNSSLISFSNRYQWDEIKWGNPKLILLTSFSQGPYSSTCPGYPCTVQVLVKSNFVKDPGGQPLDGDYDDQPGGDFNQNLLVNSASAWGDFQH